MLLRIVPRLYVVGPDAPQCELIDFHCPDLDVKLRSGTRIGRKTVQGILIETAQHVRRFTTLTRWAVGADRIVSHQVQYLVIDDGLDAIIGSMVLWSGILSSLGGFGARWPLSAKGWAPAAVQPRMELASHERIDHYTDRADSTGRILERYEVFQVPTVGREHVLYNSKSNTYARVSTTDMAFTVSV